MPAETCVTVSKYAGGGEFLSFGALGTGTNGMLDSTVFIDSLERCLLRLRDDPKKFDRLVAGTIESISDLTFVVSLPNAPFQQLYND